MNEAKKNGESILAIFQLDMTRFDEGDRWDTSRWNGRPVVIRHPGVAADGFDMGWNIAGPLGQGGFPDGWFAGWQPIEPHPDLQK